MMQSGKPPDRREYAGTLDCWRKVVRAEGWRGLMKGAGTNVVRGAGAAVVLPLFDELKRALAGGAGAQGRGQRA